MNCNQSNRHYFPIVNEPPPPPPMMVICVDTGDGGWWSRPSWYDWESNQLSTSSKFIHSILGWRGIETHRTRVCSALSYCDWSWCTVPFRDTVSMHLASRFSSAPSQEGINNIGGWMDGWRVYAVDVKRGCCHSARQRAIEEGKWVCDDPQSGWVCNYNYGEVIYGIKCTRKFKDSQRERQRRRRLLTFLWRNRSRN